MGAPDEAVVAATWAAYDTMRDVLGRKINADTDLTREQVQQMITAAAPHILAARDTALRALVEKWRERTVTVMPSTLTAADTERLTWAAAATELERTLATSLGVGA